MHLCKQATRLKVVLNLVNCLHKCMENIPYRSACLPEDEYKMFETSRRQEELDQNINLKSAFCWLTLPNSNSFRCVRTVTKIDCDCLSVRPPSTCLSVCLELSSHSNLQSGDILKDVDKMQVLSKSDKNIRHFT